jgi:hypothetical protein
VLPPPLVLPRVPRVPQALLQDLLQAQPVLRREPHRLPVRPHLLALHPLLRARVPRV